MKTKHKDVLKFDACQDGGSIFEGRLKSVAFNYWNVEGNSPWYSESKENASLSALLARMNEGTWKSLWKKRPCFLQLFFSFLRIFRRTMESWRHCFFQNWHTLKVIMSHSLASSIDCQSDLCVPVVAYLFKHDTVHSDSISSIGKPFV